MELLKREPRKGDRVRANKEMNWQTCLPGVTARVIRTEDRGLGALLAVLNLDPFDRECGFARNTYGDRYAFKMTVEPKDPSQ